MSHGARGIVYPKHFFLDPPPTQPGVSFVIMPFDETLKPVLAAITQAVSGPPWHLECQRADFFRAGHILEDILQGIADAEIVIADLTDRNPNVFYELGIVHMVKEPDRVILLSQDLDFVPFDLRGFRTIIYANTPDGLSQLQQHLAETLTSVYGERYRFAAVPGTKYRHELRLLATDKRSMCDFMIDLGSGDGHTSTKFELEVRRIFADGRVERLGRQGYYAQRGQRIPLPELPWDLSAERIRPELVEFRLVYRSDPRRDSPEA